jgi:deoxyribonucleoside regulator
VRTGTEEHNEAMLRVAQLYHEQGLTQQDIARRLHLTRWKVGRLLEEARAIGMVRIEIVHPRARRHTEEAELVRRFGLRAAVVVPGTDDEDELRARVGRAAADWLADLRPAPRALGVSWGYTLDEVAAGISHGWTRGIHVVQLNGGLSRSSRATTAADVAFRIAQAGAGTASLLAAPAILEKASVRRALESEPSVRDVLTSARAADVLLFSLGAVTESSVLVESGYLSKGDIAALRKRGACGDLLSHFIDAEGRPVDAQLESRTVGLSLEDVRAATCSVAVAAGQAKHAIVRATVTTGLAKVLVTDEATAQHLLEEA